MTLSSEDRDDDWFYTEMVGEFGEDTSGWAHERAHRLMAQLQRVDGPDAQRLEPVVLWLAEPTAFVTTGQHVFITRELMQFLDEDATAMALAHELGHHRLGHLDPLARVAPWLRRLPGSSLAAALWHMASDRVSSAENERAADRFALERCLATGFHGARCVRLFRALERLSIDRRDLDSVFGDDDGERVAELEILRLDGVTTALEEVELDVRRWGHQLWERRRRYPSLRERRLLLEAQLRGPRAA